MNGLTSNSLRMMERSMNFLWTKQAAHLDNISNAETPGYQVKTVTFENRFRSRLKIAANQAKLPTNHVTFEAKMREAIEKTGWRVEEDDEVTRMDENGVNVTEQSLEAVRTAYQIQYVMQTISSDFTTLGRAING